MRPARFLGVADAAQQLAISPARVRELVHSGQINAQRVGRELLVDADSVHRRANIVRPAAGRPLSPRMAWGLLWWLSGERAPWLAPAEHSRLRKYAGRLALEAWPRMLANRSDVHRARMLPGPLKRLRESSHVATGGVSAAMHYGIDLLAAVDDVELYVEPELFEELVDAKRINLAPEVPNVLIRVPRISPVLAFDDEHAGFAPPAAVAADLVDTGDERSVHAARQLLANLDEAKR
jgi:excisionase family DNA binding protein